MGSHRRSADRTGPPCKKVGHPLNQPRKTTCRFTIGLAEVYCGLGGEEM